MIYYNEIEPSAVLWLQAAMDEGIIAKGDIDTRSIEDVRPNELNGYTQCHFFAGIGGWSIALRLAGWPDNKPVWTGSCPCQPFSTAGKGLGVNDSRHLWPAWFWLIQQCKPNAIFGEQVANAITKGWLDDVAHDLENEGYAVGSAVLPACSVGAPHKRDRLWFLADRTSAGREGASGQILQGSVGERFTECSTMGSAEHDGQSAAAQSRSEGQTIQYNTQGQVGASKFEGASVAEYVADTSEHGLEGYGRHEREHVEEGRQKPNGHFREADLQWINCPDGKARPVKSSFHSVVNGVYYGTLGVFIQSNGEIGGQTIQTDRIKELQVLWQRVFPQEVQWPIRGLQCIQEAGALQLIMRQLAAGNKDKNISSASKEAQRRFLRELPIQQESSCPPHRQRYYEQRPAELADFMRFLPSKSPLAGGRKQKNQTEEILSCLFAAGKGAGLLPEALSESEEVWRSLPHETQGVLWHVVSQSAGLEFHHIPLLADGIPPKLRKAALHGYGNAIVPQVAAEFISAYMKCEKIAGGE